MLMKEVSQTFNKGNFIFDYFEKDLDIPFLISKKVRLFSFEHLSSA